MLCAAPGMPKPLQDTLTPQNALIFRITHRSNVPWILENGLHCGTSTVQDPNFISIGNPEIIERRRGRVVEIAPGGALAGYVPFYFTPLSPMLYNIQTGWGGIQKRNNDEIVVIVSSLPALEQHGVGYVYTDRHAYLKTARFCADPSQLADFVDFPLLRRRDFRADPDDPGKMERYQAEALAHRYVPVSAIQGVCCYTSAVKSELLRACSDLAGEIKVFVRAEWYF